MKKVEEFVRQQFSASGLMFLFCARCGKLVAYSPRSDVLAIAERSHRDHCPGAQLTVPTSCSPTVH